MLYRKAVDYLQKSAELLSSATFERTVEYMYQDTVGLITVGVGEMIPDVNAAKAYPFLKPDGSKASAEEIQKDYERVDDLAAGHLPKFYWTKDALLLGGDCIRSLLMKRLKEFDMALRGHYKKYDTFPDPVKLALLDMIYNLGGTKLFGQFKHFGKAVDAQNWKLAASHCHRIGPNAARNAWTKHQFLISEKKKPVSKLPVHPAHTDGPEMLPKIGSGPLLYC